MLSENEQKQVSNWFDGTAVQKDVQSFLSQIPKEVLPPEDPDSPEARILESARQHFAEQGFDAASTREIAEDARVNQAMIHYYYRSKLNLYKNVISSQMFLLFREIGRSLDPSETAEDFVVSMPLRMIGVLRAHPIWLKLLRREFASGGETLLLVLKELGPFGPGGFRELLRIRYKEGLGRGNLKDIDFDSVTHVLITLGYAAMLIDPLLTEISGESIMDEKVWEKRKSSIISILSHGLKTQQTGGEA